MSVSKYADILKQATDLLSKQYKYDRSVEVKTTTADGVTFKGTGALGTKGFKANLEAKFKHGNVSLEKLNIGTDGKLVGELKLLGVAKGLDATFEATEGTADSSVDSAAVFGLNFGQDWGTVTASVDVINGPVVNADALLKYQGLLVGGAVKINTNLHGGAEDSKDAGLAVEDYGVAVGYDGADFRVAAQTANQLQKIKAGYYHQVSKATAVAAAVSYDSKAVSAQIGASYQLSADTTVQGLVGSCGTVAGVYQQAFNPNVTFTAVASVDTTDLASNKHQLGLKVAFSA